MSMQTSQGNEIVSEYDQLLSYLKKHEPKTGTQEKEINEKQHRKKLQKDTKKLLDSCIESPKKSKNKKFNFSKKDDTGFDVEKFESLMRSKLIDESKRLQSYDRPYISVTEVISCIRKSYYQRQKYTIDIKSQYRFAYVSLITHVGDAVHNFIQDLYDFEEVEKTIISEKYKVKGRIDGLRGKYLIEIKTIDEDKFKGTYIPQHYHQGLVYTDILNNEYNYSISTITIVYVLRNLKKIYPFDLPYKPSLSSSFLDNAVILRQALASKKTPEPMNANKEQCRFCPYIKYCMKDGSSKIELPFNKKSNDILEKNNMNDSIFLL